MTAEKPLRGRDPDEALELQVIENPLQNNVSAVLQQLRELGFDAKRDSSDEAPSFILGAKSEDTKGLLWKNTRPWLSVREQRKQIEALLEEFYQTNGTPSNLRIKVTDYKGFSSRKPGFRLECNPGDVYLTQRLREFAQFLETKNEKDLVKSRIRSIGGSIRNILG